MDASNPRVLPILTSNREHASSTLRCLAVLSAKSPDTAGGFTCATDEAEPGQDGQRCEGGILGSRRPVEFASSISPCMYDVGDREGSSTDLHLAGLIARKPATAVLQAIHTPAWHSVSA